MSLVLCALCGEACRDDGSRSCDCAGPRVEVPRAYRLAEVAALAALDSDPVFRAAVRRWAWRTRGAA